MKSAWIGLVGGAALAFAVSPALADVKAGVDAWGRGDYAAAVREWMGPAASGDADAQFNLAQAYRLGRGVNEDLREAESWYAKAAAKGHIKAADNYGLLLFQDGRREVAMPYVAAAAERGDPRAQYLIGIAHFNGDLVPKDWVRAYALLTLSNAAGLPQAAPALKQMDDFIPLDQRQQAQVLALDLKKTADAKRASQLAAADLGGGVVDEVEAPRQVAAAIPAPVIPRTSSRNPPQPIREAAVAPSSVAAAEAAVAEAMRATGTESPATAGADYAPPAEASAAPVRVATVEPRVQQRVTPRTVSAPPPAAKPAPKPTPAPTATLPAPATPSGSGPWRLQLGAFGVGGNAEKLWSRVGGKGVLAGKERILIPSGRVTRLLAGGWASQAAAQQACNTLKSSGQDCLVTR